MFDMLILLGIVFVIGYIINMVVTLWRTPNIGDPVERARRRSNLPDGGW